jgi:UDP-N-acetylglucosamine 2-epimerase (non-hydrolysing)
MTGDQASHRILVVVGTRPEAIKMAPVIQALRELGPDIEGRLVLTGQHSDLLDDALASFSLESSWELGIMRPDQTLYDVAHGCLDGLRAVTKEWRPDLILVQGDTASVFLGALVGFFEGIPAGHVEAGLRSGDLRRPFPEEGFRRMAGVLARLHFAPTEGARENLLREGVPPAWIHVTGNTVVDALLEIAGRTQVPDNPVLRRLLAREGRPFALLTAHRREAFGEPLERILGGVRTLAEAHPELEILYPVHPNPHVRQAARRVLGDHPRIHLEAPLGYRDLVAALRGAALVLTDSGGIQEEAPTFGTPVLVLREVTERPEGLEAGLARLVGFDPDLLVREAGTLLREEPEAREARRGRNPYGDGRAGERIAREVARFLRSEGSLG